VPPLDPSLEKDIDFSSEQLVSTFLQLHRKVLMNNVLAYRLAHRYLAKTGVVVLSCGQKEFLEYKKEQKRPAEAEVVHETYGKDVASSLLSGMVD
jgi:hypothetical protein